MKLSVITVNYNNKEGLDLTVKSVLKQTLREFEYIIIDGLSTDGSCEVLAAHDSQIDLWLSEADQGVYFAMNKGVRLASGDYIFFLNSGDSFYSDNTLRDVREHLEGEHDIVFGDVNVIHSRGAHKRELITCYPETIRFSFLFRQTICHQAMFLRRSLFSRVGLYPEKYKLCSDWAHLVSALIEHKSSYKKVPVVITNYPHDGMSSSVENRRLLMEERNDFLTQAYGPFYDDYSEYSSLTQNPGVLLLTAVQMTHVRRKMIHAILRILSMGLPRG